MDRAKQWLLDTFVYAGLNRNEYRKIEKEIAKRNQKMLGTASIVGSLFFVFLVILTFFVDTIRGNRLLYADILLDMLVLILVAYKFLPSRRQFMPLFFYAFLEICYVFTMIIGVVNQPELPATSFVAILFVGPLLFIDRPCFMTLDMVGNTLLICYVSHLAKGTEVAALDQVNLVSICIAAVIVNCIMTRVQVSEIAKRRYIEEQQDIDDLTRLFTKAAMERKVKEYMNRTKETAAFFILDIDDFKQANDTYGHAYGDTVLRLMGQCVGNVLTDRDMAGRFGGDEFVLFLTEIRDEVEIERRAQALQEEVRSNFELPDKLFSVHISLGISVYPEQADSYEQLFERADQALYKAKESGKDCFWIYGDKQ